MAKPRAEVWAILAPDCGVEFRVMMPVQVGPDGGVSVKVFASADVFQNRAMAADKDDGFAFQPVPHLGEGMPEIFVIQFSEKMHERIFDF